MPRRPIPDDRKKREVTRDHILDVALGQLRKQGFDKTTMRGIATAAGLSLGAAYYYFPSKEAIVRAWYDRTQAEHLALARDAFRRCRGFRSRARAVVQSKVDLLAPDRKLLAAVFRATGAAEHPLAVFAPETAELRAQSIAIFDEAIGDEPLPESLRPAVARALWLLHLGALLALLGDRSPKYERTRKLVDGAVDLFVDLVGVLGMPGLEPLRRRALGLLADAGLLD